ncbi:MAG TPA: DUF4386 domain-containing protein [Candidatus Polarisedimenticolia bacterium]|nr:DUF4386 domain-containing protein [Candidatus Polarisedimenticolia bacterium]
MIAIRNPGRAAGAWYLLLILLGPLRLIYIPRTLFVDGDAAATIANIAAHQRLFRLGILADVAGGVLLVLVVMAFFRLFREVDAPLAWLVVIFGGVMPAVLFFVSTVSDFGLVLAAQRAPFLSAFSPAQQDALAMLGLALRDGLTTAAEFLWGVWLFPLAALIERSRVVPRILGLWLALNGLAYVLISVVGILAPQHQEGVFRLTGPARYGELALVLWLLVRGSRTPVSRSGEGPGGNKVSGAPASPRC